MENFIRTYFRFYKKKKYRKNDTLTHPDDPTLIREWRSGRAKIE